MKTKFIIALILLTLPISGCVTYTHAYKARKLLPKLQTGQSKNDVLCLMEHLPHKIDRFEHHGDMYEIWYYNIQEHYTDNIKLIPLVFKNHKLTGWGEAALGDTPYKCFLDNKLGQNSARPID